MSAYTCAVRAAPSAAPAAQPRTQSMIRCAASATSSSSSARATFLRRGNTSTRMAIETSCAPVLNTASCGQHLGGTRAGHPSRRHGGSGIHAMGRGVADHRRGHPGTSTTAAGALSGANRPSTPDAAPADTADADTIRRNGMSIDESDRLSLDNIRASLIRQEDSIIFGLIERAQYLCNAPVYEPGGVEVPCFKLDGTRACMLEFMLRENEQVGGKIRRYTSPDEHAFYPDDLPLLVIGRGSAHSLSLATRVWKVSDSNATLRWSDPPSSRHRTLNTHPPH